MKLSAENREKLLAGLNRMPHFVAERFAGLPDSLHAKPGPGGTFSPVEQVWHLADLETMGFAERIRRLRAESDPRLPDFRGDAVARERNYKALSLTEGVEAFRRAREENLRVLRTLTEEEWNRTGEQEGVGPFTLGDLPLLMAEHDDSHREEIDSWLGHLQR